MPELDQDAERRIGELIRAYMVSGTEAVDPVSARIVLAQQRSKGTRWAGRRAVDAILVGGLILVAAVLVGPQLGFLSPASTSHATQTPGLGTTEPATVAASSAPTSVLTERERSDRYWQTVSNFAPTNFHYSSLSQISSDSHLIVRGRVTAIQEGMIEPFEDDGPRGGAGRSTHFGVVAIDEVLKGEPATTSPGTILVARLVFQFTEADLPEGEVVLFLKNYAQMRLDEGYPPASDALDRYYYVRANGYQCVLRNIDGIVEIVDGPRGWEEAIGPFPAPLDGSPFAEVLARIRTLVADQSTPPSPF